MNFIPSLILTILWLVPQTRMDVVTGWSIGGSNPAAFEMGLDKGAGRMGGHAATIRSKSGYEEGDGTLMQVIQSGTFADSRVRFSGYMKTDNVTDAAGLWLQAGRGEKVLAVDQMEGREIKGTKTWTKVALVMDIPRNSETISFGVFLEGGGQVWFDEMSFEKVDETVEVTNLFNGGSLPSKPENLNIE